MVTTNDGMTNRTLTSKILLPARGARSTFGRKVDRIAVADSVRVPPGEPH